MEVLNGQYVHKANIVGNGSSVIKTKELRLCALPFKILYLMEFCSNFSIVILFQDLSLTDCWQIS